MDNKLITTERFNDHCNEYDRRMAAIEKDNNSIHEELGEKVSWIIFWSIVGLLVVIVGAMWGLVYSEIKDLGRTVDTTQQEIGITNSDVSYIKGILDNSEKKE